MFRETRRTRVVTTRILEGGLKLGDASSTPNGILHGRFPPQLPCLLLRTSPYISCIGLFGDAYDVQYLFVRGPRRYSSQHGMEHTRHSEPINMPERQTNRRLNPPSRPGHRTSEVVLTVDMDRTGSDSSLPSGYNLDASRSSAPHYWSGRTRWVFLRRRQIVCTTSCYSCLTPYHSQ
ncbi:hypothetical protein PISMIDRAFT_423061 [Pisolithus microcarpus 441]|uniref:Uncharacterized protein n=1 Tax=Pisolithus microcarpus 441 TaxID=765257 RepID=A0A0C9ZP43_9AGAM|nr:hypothetical protein PISMIDRAFT_423061 [Pisolithus microcarpus 441]